MHELSDIISLVGEISRTPPSEVLDEVLKTVDEKDYHKLMEIRLLSVIETVEGKKIESKHNVVVLEGNQFTLYNRAMIGFIAGSYFAIRLLKPEKQVSRRQLINAFLKNDEEVQDSNFLFSARKLHCNFTIPQMHEILEQITFMSKDRFVRRCQVVACLDGFFGLLRSIQGDNSWVSAN